MEYTLTGRQAGSLYNVKLELASAFPDTSRPASMASTWQVACLAYDFVRFLYRPQKEPWIDEMNLLYVACTRAMRVLAVNSTMLEIMKEFVDRRDGRKPNTPMVFRKKQVAAA